MVEVDWCIGILEWFCNIKLGVVGGWWVWFVKFVFIEVVVYVD